MSASMQTFLIFLPSLYLGYVTHSYFDMPMLNAANIAMAFGIYATMILRIGTR